LILVYQLGLIIGVRVTTSKNFGLIGILRLPIAYKGFVLKTYLFCKINHSKIQKTCDGTMIILEVDQQINLISPRK